MRLTHSTALAFMAAAAMMAGASFAVSAQTAPIVMKLACPTLNDNAHEYMKRYAAAVEKKSSGRIKAELYPAGQLGSIPRMIELTQQGAIQVLLLPPEFFVGVDQRFELLSAAGLFENDQHAIKTISDPEFSKAFLTLGGNKGLTGVDLYFTGPQAFAMRRPFRTLDDIKGKKIRVLASQFQTEQVNRLGATGVPMSLGDVLPALQQGTVDGALGTMQLFSALAYYDTVKYANETGQAYVFNVTALSKTWFTALPADLQSMLVATAREVGDDVNQWELDFNSKQRKVWVEKGAALDALSSANHAELMTRTRAVAEDIVKAKPDLKPLWDQLVAAAKRNM
jgi:TRAP-type transport system periplasmic protein